MKNGVALIQFLFVAGSCLFMGCKKDHIKGPLQVFSGYIYEDCSMAPSANRYVDLYEGIGGWNGELGGLLASGHTDVNGHFKLEFRHSGVGDIRLRAGGDLMINIPYNADTTGMVIFRYATAIIQVKLNVMNSYSVNDTLFILKLGPPNEIIAIPAPLTSGIIYTDPNYTLLVMDYPYPLGGTTSTSVVWTINNDGSHYKDFIITKFCDDTTFVTVDIN